MVVRRLVSTVVPTTRRQAVEYLLAKPGRLKDISPGLVPIGDTGLYATPETPADPRDCARYPTSPWCGGVPFSTEVAALGPQIINTKCDKGIRLNPVLFFVRLPPIAIVYREPECRKLEEKRPLKFAKFELDVNPGRATHTTSRSDLYWERYPGRIEHQGIYKAVKKPDFYVEASIDPGTYPLVKIMTPESVHTADPIVQKIYINYPYPGTQVSGGSYDFYTILDLWDIEYTDTNWQRRKWFVDNIPSSSKLYRLHLDRGIYRKVTVDFDGDLATVGTDVFDLGYVFPIDALLPPFDNVRSDFYPYPPPPPKFMDCCCNEDLLKAIYKKNKQIYQILGGDKWQTDGDTAANLQITPESEVEKAIAAQYTDKGEPKQASITDLIALLLHAVGPTHYRAGLQQLPAKLPKRLIYPTGEGDEEVKTLSEFLGYQVKQLDRAIGFLPQKIKIADTNPGKEGNQSIEVEIHSLSDFVREVLQSVMETAGDVDVANNMLVRILMESGLIHQFAVQIAAMCDATVEHMDFKHNWKTVKVPFAFDPYAGLNKDSKGFAQPKQNIDENLERVTEDLLPKLLKNAEVEIRIVKNEEKKSLNDVLQDIKRDTAAAAGAVTERATPERLEQLVAACQALIQMQGILSRSDTQKAIVSGKLRTRKKR